MNSFPVFQLNQYSELSSKKSDQPEPDCKSQKVKIGRQPDPILIRGSDQIQVKKKILKININKININKICVV